MIRRSVLIAVLAIAAAAPTVSSADNAVVRRLAWSGGPSIEFILPARITLTQSPTVSLVVRGPKDVVDRVYVSGDQVLLRRTGWPWWGGTERRRLDIEASGPMFNHIVAASAADLTIPQLKSDRLDLAIHSAANAKVRLEVADLRVTVHSAAHLKAAGIADKVRLEVHSAASGDLGELAANSVDVTAHSAASAIINAKVLADAEAHSAASVRVVSKPQTLRMRSHSAGSVTVSG